MVEAEEKKKEVEGKGNGSAQGNRAMSQSFSFPFFLQRLPLSRCSALISYRVILWRQRAKCF